MKRTRTRHIQGFTMIEIMMAVAVIALIGAVSVPAISTIRDKTIEARAKANLETLRATCEDYWVANNSYPGSIQVLTQGVAPYLDASWNSSKGGYLYSIDNSNKYEVELKAIPDNPIRYKTLAMNKQGEISGITTAAAEPGIQEATVNPNLSRPDEDPLVDSMRTR